jgi:hypothetical protein
MLPLLAALPALLLAAAAAAQRPPQENIDASKMPEAGPLVTGGSGETTGPNSRNQAVSPMPGSDEQLSELPSRLSIPLGPQSPPSTATPGKPRPTPAR